MSMLTEGEASEVITITCVDCSHSYAHKPTYRRTIARCPECSHRVAVPPRDRPSAMILEELLATNRRLLRSQEKMSRRLIQIATLAAVIFLFQLAAHLYPVLLQLVNELPKG